MISRIVFNLFNKIKSKLFSLFNNLENSTHKIMKNGLSFCLFLCIISIIILITYRSINPSPLLFHIGISLFKLSLYYVLGFITCGLVIDNIKKGLI